MKLLVVFAMIALAFAQDDYDLGPEPALDASVEAVTEWPQNDDALGGALVSMAYSDIGDGSCTVDLPSSVDLFHVMNGHVVPGDGTNPVEGDYKVAAPAGWEAINGTLEVLILYERDNIFNISEIVFACDPEDVAELSVYSFPQNNLVKEASSNVFYRPGFHQGDVLTIGLPSPVARFNITGADSRWQIDSEGGQTWTISGFVNEDGVDDQKEVHFSIDYLEGPEGEEKQNWFSAGQVTVSVTQDEEIEEPADA